MKVLRFKYKLPEINGMEFNSFETDMIELTNSNLFVGKNASGKSTLANLLYSFVEMIKGTWSRIGEYYIEIAVDEQNIYKYSCDVIITEKLGIEITEVLSKNEVILLNRTNTEAKIYSEIEKDDITINPPHSKLIFQVRRDEKAHPFLEEIILWAESVHSFKFGHIHSSSFINSQIEKSALSYNESLTSIKEKDLNKILGELKSETKSKIIDEFNCLGYNVTILNIKLVGASNVIHVKEKNIKYEISQSQLSQGMFRSLFLLLFIHHLIEKEHAKMIIIDDLCEGLDYERASKLGKIVFRRMEENRIQFVATSNDSFLMNVVDIKNWNIIYRGENKIKVFNYRNNKDQFDKFKMTGLNNFDLFSSNYLEFTDA